MLRRKTKTEKRGTESKMDIFYIANALYSFSRRLRGHFLEQEWVWDCLSISCCSEPEFRCIGLEWSLYAPFFLSQRHLLSYSEIPVPLSFFPSGLGQADLVSGIQGRLSFLTLKIVCAEWRDYSLGFHMHLVNLHHFNAGSPDLPCARTLLLMECWWN